jgi:hypothetical protein
MRWIEMLNIARSMMKIDGVRPRSVPFQGRQVRAITAPWPTASIRYSPADRDVGRKQYRRRVIVRRSAGD